MYFTPERKMLPQNFINFGVGISQISHHYGPVFTGLHTGRKLTFGQPLRTKSALLHHTLHPGRITRVGVFNVRPGVFPVKATGPIRTGRHTEPATDAPVHVHHDDPVFPFKRGLGRTDPHTWRMLTMVTEHNKFPLVQILVQVLVRRVRKSVLKLLFPDPLDFVLFVRDQRHVMRVMARFNTFLTRLVFLTNPGINYHAPAPRGKRLLRRLYRVSLDLPFT